MREAAKGELDDEYSTLSSPSPTMSVTNHREQFFKRALEFAHMSILVDSISYEGYYSKAHILKDLG